MFKICPFAAIPEKKKSSQSKSAALMVMLYSKFLCVRCLRIIEKFISAVHINIDENHVHIA